MTRSLNRRKDMAAPQVITETKPRKFSVEVKVEAVDENNEIILRSESDDLMIKRALEAETAEIARILEQKKNTKALFNVDEEPNDEVDKFFLSNTKHGDIYIKRMYCEICSLELNLSMKDFKSHLVKEHPDPRVFDFKVLNGVAFIYFNINKDLEIPYNELRCLKCDLSFSYRFAWTKHHSKEYHYCSTCGLCFRSCKVYREHVCELQDVICCAEEDDNINKCIVCSKQFKTDHDLFEHTVNIHTVSSTELMPDVDLSTCKVCKQRYPGLKSTHFCPKAPFKYGCQNCMRPFQSLLMVYCHRKAYKKYNMPCPKCKKMLERDCEIESHTCKALDNTIMFQCLQCSQDFNDRVQAVNHLIFDHKFKTTANFDELLFRYQIATIPESQSDSQMTTLSKIDNLNIAEEINNCIVVIENAESDLQNETASSALILQQLLDCNTTYTPEPSHVYITNESEVGAPRECAIEISDEEEICEESESTGNENSPKIEKEEDDDVMIVETETPNQVPVMDETAVNAIKDEVVDDVLKNTVADDVRKKFTNDVISEITHDLLGDKITNVMKKITVDVLKYKMADKVMNKITVDAIKRETADDVMEEITDDAMRSQSYDDVMNRITIDVVKSEAPGDMMEKMTNDAWQDEPAVDVMKGTSYDDVMNQITIDKVESEAPDDVTEDRSQDDVAKNEMTQVVNDGLFITIKTEPIDEPMELDDVIIEPMAEVLVDNIKMEPPEECNDVVILHDCDDLLTACGHKTIKREVSDSDLKCKRCSVTFDSIQDIINHIQTSACNAYKCSFCSHICKTQEDHERHIIPHIRMYYNRIKIFNGNREFKAFRCIRCLKVVLDINLTEHWRAHVKRNAAGVRRTKPVDDIVLTPEVTVKSEPVDGETREESVVDKLIACLLKKRTDIKYGDRCCVVCNKLTSRVNDFKRHCIEHLLDDAYKKNGVLIQCQICREQFDNSTMYRQHLREHANLPVYQCRLCSKSFSDSSNYTKHRKVHNISVLICDLCSKKFSSKNMLVQHIERHAQTKPVQCSLCPQVFPFESNFNRHMKSCHMLTPKFHCQRCKEPFFSLKHKWNHLWSQHRIRKVMADCPYCGAGFRKMWDVKSHISREHAGMPAPPKSYYRTAPYGYRITD